MKKTKGIISGLVVLLALAVIGGGSWYYVNQSESEGPPSLKIPGSSFQGSSVETALGFLKFDAADVTAWDNPSATLQTAAKGINYFHLNSATDVIAIIDEIKPQVDLKVLLVIWSAGEADLNINKGWYTYPVGPYVGTTDHPLYEISDPATFEIPSKRGFGILANKDFEYNTDVLKDSKDALSDNTVVDLHLASDETGWVMVPFPSSDTDTKAQAALVGIEDRIKSMWDLTTQFGFGKVQDLNNYTLGEYKMVWLNLETGTVTPDPAVCGDGVLESPEECDDGNVVDGDGCDALCVTETPVGPECGDGNIDTGEECDDGNIAAGDGCDSACALEPTEICGNNITDGTDVCDGTDLNTRDCTNFAPHQGFNSGTLGCTADCSAYDTSACVTAACGDGIVDSGEDCDDGNTTDGDGCDASCETETLTFQFAPLVAQMATFPATVDSVTYLSNLNSLNMPTGTPSYYLDSNFYDFKDDSLSDPYVMAAVKVEVGGTSGSLTLQKLFHGTIGYTLENPNDLELFYCEGNSDWVLSMITEADNGSIIIKRLGTDEGKNYIFQDGDFSGINSSVPLEDQAVPAGKWAVYVLLMNDMDHCNDVSQVPPNELGNGSESETTFNRMIFEKEDGTTEDVWNVDIINKASSRMIDWIN